LLVKQRHRVLLCAFPEPTRSEARRRCQAQQR
jgi:hypothetical protein